MKKIIFTKRLVLNGFVMLLGLFNLSVYSQESEQINSVTDFIQTFPSIKPIMDVMMKQPLDWQSVYNVAEKIVEKEEDGTYPDLYARVTSAEARMNLLLFDEKHKGQPFLPNLTDEEQRKIRFIVSDLDKIYDSLPRVKIEGFHPMYVKHLSEKTLYLKGSLYMFLPEYNLAMTSFQKIIENNPDSPFLELVFKHMADLYTHDQKTEEGITFFESYLQSNPNDKIRFTTLYNCAVLKLRSRDYDSAVGYIEKAMKGIQDENQLAQGKQMLETIRLKKERQNKEGSK